MKIKILSRKGKDLFEHLELAALDPNRAIEDAIVNFVLINDEPATLEDIALMDGEKLAIIKGRVFTTQVKGIKQTDDELQAPLLGITIPRKKLKHNILEELQLKVQRVKEKGDDVVMIIKTLIPVFYDIKISDLEEVDYSVAAFMFSKINSFFSQTSKPEDEFEIDD